MRKLFVKIISFVLIFAALLCTAGCSEDREAKDNLSEMFAMLKNGEYLEAMDKYVAGADGGSDFLNCEGSFDRESFPAYDMHMAVFKSLKYKIKSSDIVSENEIHFKTEITAIDLEPVGRELAETAAAYNISSENAESDEKLSDSEINNIMSQQMVSISGEYLDSGDVAKRTSEVEISMYYDPAGRWFVHMDDPLADALTGGVYSAYYDSLSKADMVTKEQK